MKEARHLVKVEVIWDGQDGWTLKYDNRKTKVFRGDKTAFAKYLQKIQAKDDMTSPKSVRNETYKEIVDDIVLNRDRIIWVWSTNMKENTYKVEKDFRIPGTNIVLESGDEFSILAQEKTTKTAKCPKCGNKYLVSTGYCVSCKKKVAEPKSEATARGTDYVVVDGNEIIDGPVKDKRDLDKGTKGNVSQVQDLPDSVLKKHKLVIKQ